MQVLIVLSACLVGAFAAGSNAGVAQFQHLVKTEVSKLFVAADANKNGNFDKADMSNLFTLYDANHDKAISEKEFNTRFTGKEQGLASIAKGLFLELDMDKSGSVTDSDLNLYFKKLDQNDDGKVEKSEFEKYFTELFTILFVIEAKNHQN